MACCWQQLLRNLAVPIRINTCLRRYRHTIVPSTGLSGIAPEDDLIKLEIKLPVGTMELFRLGLHNGTAKTTREDELGGTKSIPHYCNY